MDRVHQLTIEHFAVDVTRKSPKGWCVDIPCPFCGEKSKFGIKLNDTTKSSYKNKISYRCFKGSCGVKGTEYSLFKYVGKLHLLPQHKFLGDTDKVENHIVDLEEMILNLEVPTRPVMVGFRKVRSNQYLESRGFESWQFDAYNIGTTLFMKNRVLFSIIEDGENKGYVARSTHSSEKLDQLKADGYTVPKYKNEGGVDFARLVYGIDEVVENDEVVIVEGVTDKANVDRIIQRLKIPNLKCVVTFGKKISNEQLLKLKLKGVTRLLFLYDLDAIEELKRYSFQAKLWFKNIKVGFLPKDKDPGDIALNEFEIILQTAESPDQFFSEKVKKKELK